MAENTTTSGDLSGAALILAGDVPRLVATAAEDRLSIKRNLYTRRFSTANGCPNSRA